MPMKSKIFVFIVLVFSSIMMVSCRWLEEPANIEIIGSGYIQCNNGIYSVEIDSIRYSLERVYADVIATHSAVLKPVEGMLVTCFRKHGSPRVEFFAGNPTEEYLEDFFTDNPTIFVVCCLVLMLCLVWITLNGGPKTMKVPIVRD